MGKAKSAKRNKTSRKIQDLPAKGKRAGAVKGGFQISKEYDKASPK